MSPEDNKKLVTGFVEPINRKDRQPLEEFVAPDFTRHSNTSGQPQIRSLAELRSFLIGQGSTFPDAQETIHFLLAEGDKVALHSEFRGTQEGLMGPFPASGRRLSADFIRIYQLAIGRVVGAWVEWDNLSGLIQLGHFGPYPP